MSARHISQRSVIDRWIESVDSCPWNTVAGRPADRAAARHHASDRVLYTAEERRRRDASPWTVVQGVMAPLQFGVFVISLCLVVRFLSSGEGLAAATASVVIKTFVLYAIMITGAIWEREVFGCYLFAPTFLREDLVSILVLALHTFYLLALLSGAVDANHQMVLALAAYAAYVVNATQFLLKLRAARHEHHDWPEQRPGQLGSSE